MSKPLRIALLSHRFGNIGHLFMAIGFEEIVRDTFGSEVEIDHFEQHHFFSVYPRYHPLRLTHLVPHGRIRSLRVFLNQPSVAKLLWPHAVSLKKYSTAIACGGPSIVRGVSSAPEMGLMFHHQLGAFAYHNVPTMDLAVGSGGIPLDNVPEDLNAFFGPDDQRYFRRLFEIATVSTVRDQLAKKIWAAMGRDAPLIPCGAIASGRRFEKYSFSGAESDRYIVINFQRLGANQDWGQSIDPLRWRGVIRVLIERLRPRHKLLFVCHDENERRQASEIDSAIPVFLPRSEAEYGSVMSGAKAAITNRIHAAIPLAGIGVAAVGVGTDTRLGTLELIGLKTYFVRTVTTEQLEDAIESNIQFRAREKERLINVREETMTSYRNILISHVR